jgi:hypothetical protein
MTLTHPLMALASPSKCDRRRPTKSPITGNPSASPEVTVPSALEVVGGKSSRGYQTRVAGTFGFSPLRALHSARDRPSLVSCSLRPWGCTLQSLSLSRSRSPLGASALLTLPLQCCLPSWKRNPASLEDLAACNKPSKTALARPAEPDTTMVATRRKPDRNGQDDPICKRLRWQAQRGVRRHLDKRALLHDQQVESVPERPTVAHPPKRLFHERCPRALPVVIRRQPKPLTNQGTPMMPSR